MISYINAVILFWSNLDFKGRKIMYSLSLQVRGLGNFSANLKIKLRCGWMASIVDLLNEMYMCDNSNVWAPHTNLMPSIFF